MKSGIPRCEACDKRLYPDHPRRKKYCSDRCANMSSKKAMQLRKAASEAEARNNTAFRRRVTLIRTALLMDPFATVREIADETGLGETQITTALKRTKGMTLSQYRRHVYHTSREAA